MTTITEDSHFKIKAGAVAIIIFFVASTVVSIGNSRVTKVEEDIDTINRDRIQSRQKLYDEISIIRADVAEIKGMLKERNK